MVAQIALMILHFNNTPEDTEYSLGLSYLWI